MQASGGKITATKEKNLGIISGMAALYSENDLKNILITQLESKLKEFKTINIDSMTDDELKKWSKWSGSVDSLLEKADASLSEARKLLQVDNFIPIRKLLDTLEDKQQLQRYIDSIST